MKLFTIGFTQKSARQFFDLLGNAGVRTVIDIRENNRSQLAGFTKVGDLPFFLEKICGIDYVHHPDLAPTRAIRDLHPGTRKDSVKWAQYRDAFIALLTARRVERGVPPELLDRGCLLCSEHEPEYCHRRLLAEYLAEKLPGTEVVHLV
jgi:uncharacterized protein (DUF488 family)